MLGVVTGTAIRGTTVVVPSEYAWADAREVVTTGGAKQGYLGLGSMPVLLAAGQREGGRDRGLLVTAVAADGPAAAAGVVVGDIIVAFDGAPVDDHDALLASLRGDRVGKVVTLGLVRGHAAVDLAVTVGERQGR